MIRESEIVGRKLFLTFTGLGASSSSFRGFVVPVAGEKYIVKGAAARFGVASTSGTLQLEVAAIDVDAGSGTNQLDTALDLSQTEDENLRGKISTPTVIDDASSLNVVLGGTLTNLADCVLTVELEKVN
ncbi:MAG: hypothetical protein KGJ07_01570 [Patescibacteria group bacterium]|nr:hypothetical protein [Patescibacteria group bacterium]